MIQYMLQYPGNESVDGLRSIAVNVIGQAGYHQKRPWSPGLKKDIMKTGTTGRNLYVGTLYMITYMFLEATTLPTKLLKLPFMPPEHQSLGYHLERMHGYAKQVLEEERQAGSHGSGPRHNFLSLLLQLSDQEKRNGDEFSLTDQEISGNLFLFSAAGFETTANTMIFAVILLAAYPEWQEWIREELQCLDPDVSSWEYERVFPKCRRTLALMMEDLRHFPPLLHASRGIASPQTIISMGETHHLAPPMDVFVCQVSVHMDPATWGPDVHAFRPTRFLDDDGQIVCASGKGNVSALVWWTAGLSGVEDVAGRVCGYHSDSFPESEA